MQKNIFFLVKNFKKNGRQFLEAIQWFTFSDPPEGIFFQRFSDSVIPQRISFFSDSVIQWSPRGYLFSAIQCFSDPMTPQMVSFFSDSVIQWSPRGSLFSVIHWFTDSLILQRISFFSDSVIQRFTDSVFKYPLNVHSFFFVVDSLILDLERFSDSEWFSDSMILS